MIEGFRFKHVYPSEQGLHIELHTEAEAYAAYQDAKNRGINNVEVDGVIYTWKLPNNRRNPCLIPVRQGVKVNRGKLRLPQFRQLVGVALGRRLSRSRKAAPLHS